MTTKEICKRCGQKLLPNETDIELCNECVEDIAHKEDEVEEK